MINLIPPGTRSGIMYARRNKMLRNWAFAMLLGIAGIVFVVLIGVIQIDQRVQQLETEVAASHEELKAARVDETQSRAEEMSNSFKLVTQVLSKQILFSEVLKQVGSVIPDGASLATLSLEQLTGGIDLQVSAKDYQTATQVQVNLQDSSNKLFDKADIVNISCDASGESIYPCTGNYRASYTNNNPFLFLNAGGAEQ
jgi:Tfp pilus assembly protein PilN